MNTIQQHTLPSVTPEMLQRKADLNNSLKMWGYLLLKLPAAWFMGIRVGFVDFDCAEATLPMAWRSQNPFRSIYFAALCGAGELSTGVLVLLALAQFPNKKISMLVTHIEANFYKKATTQTTFRCEQGVEVAEVIRQAVATGDGKTLAMKAVGRSTSGEIVAEVTIHWSFKCKS
jgi:hypothetical protein